MLPRPPRFAPPDRLQVMVVSAHRRHHEAVAAALRRLAPKSRSEWVGESLEAMRRSLTARMQLVVVDWSTDEAAGVALLRHLARWRPDVAVLAFDEQAFRRDEWPRRVAAWQDLEAELAPVVHGIENRSGRTGETRLRA